MNQKCSLTCPPEAGSESSMWARGRLRVLYVGWMHSPDVVELQLVLRHAGE